MPIPGTITVLQPIAPNSPNDIGPSHLARYGLGGIHSVGTTAERDAISFVRREVGMLAYVSSLNKYYSLVGSTSNTAWVEFTVDAAGGNPAGPNGAIQFRDGTGFSGVSSLTYNSSLGLLVLGSDAAIEFGDGSVQRTARNFYGLTGATSPDYPSGVSGTGYTGDRLLLATGPSADPFRNYVRFGNAWFQTGVVGIGQGPQGIQGTAGERGATGATGLSGEKGERGETGSPGEPGERGATGPTGERGATGFGGATGPEGALQFNDGGQLSGDAGLIFDSGTRNIVLGSDVAIGFGDGSVQRTARNFYGLTGATSAEYPQGMSFAGYTGDRLLIATGPSTDPLRNYVKFGNAWVQTGVVGIGQGPQGIQGTAGERGATGATGTFTGNFVSSLNGFTGDVIITSGENISIDFIPDPFLGNYIRVSATGFGQFFGITGPTTPSFPIGMSGSGNTGDRLLIATGPSADPFRNYIKFGNGWFQTGVVGIGQGPQGIQGTAGERGATGEPGERGATGSTGEPGERGATGATGFGGATGPQGALQFNDGGELSGNSGLLYSSIEGKLVLGSDVVLEFGDGTTQGTARNFYSLLGATSEKYPTGMSVFGNTGDRLLIATGPQNDPFRNYVRFGRHWFQTGVVGLDQASVGPTGPTGAQVTLIRTVSTTIPDVFIKGIGAQSLSGNSIDITYAGGLPLTGSIFLTDPTKGTGFPVYFNTAQMESVVFTDQTLTGSIGDTITIRIAITGENGSSDSQDIAIVVGNEVRWGTSSLPSLTAGGILNTLNGFAAKNNITHEFSLGLSDSAGTYAYFVHPKRFGRSRQSINNAAYGGMILQGDIVEMGESSLTYTNINGYAEQFYVYRSENRFVNSSILVKSTPVS